MNNKMIFILGSTSYQNESLAYYLEHERGIECQILPPDCEIVSKSAETNWESRLFLLDCSDMGVERYFTHPQLGADRLPFQHPVSIFNARRDSGIEEKALLTGVKGIFYKEMPLGVFIDAILEILDGGTWFPEDMMVKWISRQRRRVIVPVKDKLFLSSREVEILGKLCGGLTNDEIAEELCISLYTVKTHLQNIYRKIKVNNRTQAIIWSAKNLVRNQVDLSWLGDTHVERTAVGNH